MIDEYNELEYTEPDQPHAVYRFFDAESTLLYVGISLNVMTRLIAHRTDKPWFQDAATITLEWFPDQGAAEEAELAAIESESPLHNKAGVTSTYRGKGTSQARAAKSRRVVIAETFTYLSAERRQWYDDRFEYFYARHPGWTSGDPTGELQRRLIIFTLKGLFRLRYDEALEAQHAATGRALRHPKASWLDWPDPDRS